MGRHALDEDLEPSDALAPRDDLAAIASWFRHQHISGPASLGLDQGARGRAADLLVGNIEVRHTERRIGAGRAELAESVIGEIGAALHVVDSRTESAVAVNPKRQALDEPERMHGVEMAQHQNARRLLSPG